MGKKLKNAWPALKSGMSQKTSTVSVEENGGLSRLPDELLLSIWSRLTMEEAAKTSVVSHKWKQLWESYPGVFLFDDWKVKRNKSGFVNLVTQVVEKHCGPAVEEFRVAFDLDSTYQFHIDKWVEFALTKGAKTLELDFCIMRQIPPRQPLYTLHSVPLKNPALKSLVLCRINVITEVIVHFLRSCPFLEELLIDRAEGLTSLRVSEFPLGLKHLDVNDCPKLENIDVVAPKLLTFRYEGGPVQLHIRNASLLSEVSIGGQRTEVLAHAFDSLSCYFSHWEYLHLMISLSSQMDLGPPPVPKLTNLRHLRLSVGARSDQTLLGWITLIQAAPVLQSSTLELSYSNKACGTVGRHDNPQPLNCLKTLELCGFLGQRNDLEIATYVLENAVVLEEVIVNLRDHSGGRIVNILGMSRNLEIEIKQKLPPGARLVIKE